MYVEVEVQHHTFLNLALGGEGGQLHILVALLQGRRPQYLKDRRLSRSYSSQSVIHSK